MIKTATIREWESESSLAVSIKQLKHDTGRVREVITYQGDVINVYEPNLEATEKIIRMQERFMDTEDITQLDVSGEDMIYLFKLLTDIDGLDDITGEDLQDIIENPSIPFLMTQHAIEGIITEIYKMTILQAKNAMMEQDFNMKAAGVMNGLFNYSMAAAAQNEDTKDQVSKINRQTKDLQEQKSKVTPIKKKDSTTKAKMSDSKTSKGKERGALGQVKSSKTKAEQIAMLEQYQSDLGVE